MNCLWGELIPVQHFWLISVEHKDENQAHRAFVERRQGVIKKTISVVVAVLSLQTAYAQSCGAIQNQDRRSFCYAKTKGNPGMCGAVRPDSEGRPVLTKMTLRWYRNPFNSQSDTYSE